MAKGHEPTKSQIIAAQTTESPDARVTFACFRFCSEDGFLWSVLTSVSWCCGTPPRPGCSPSVARFQLWEGGGVCSGPVVPGFSLESSPVQSRTRSSCSSFTFQGCCRSFGGSLGSVQSLAHGHVWKIKHLLASMY